MSFLAYYRSKIASENKRCAMIHRIVLAIMVTVVLGSAVSLFIHRKSELVSSGAAGEFWQGTGTVEADNSCYIDDGFAMDAVLFLSLEELALEKGTYRLTIYYDNTDTNAVSYLRAPSADYDSLLVDEEFWLRKGYHDSSMEFYVKEALTDLNVRTYYLGSGELTVHSFILEKTNRAYLIRLFNVLILILAVVGIYYYAYRESRGISKEERFTLLFLIGTIIVSSYPLFVDFLYMGHDLSFHLLRIEGLKSAIISGQVPARVQPLWYFGAGYATSLYYCDMPLLFPALLRIMGVPVQTAWQMFLLLANILTCLSAYYSFHHMTRNRLAALVGTFLYTTSIYRLNNLYRRAAVGEFSAMIFLPLVLYGMWLILCADQKSKKISIFPLTIGITGCILSHVLSTEVAALLLILICIIFSKKIIKEKRFLYLLKAAGLTLLLSAWFLIPFLTEFSKVSAAGGEFVRSDVDRTGTFLAQLFMTFPAGNSEAENEYALAGIRGEMSLAVGLPILLAVFFVMAAVYVTKCYKTKKLKDFWVLLILGVLLLVLSNHRFPWDSIANYFAANHLAFIGKMIGSIQFLWRLVGFAVLLFCAAVSLGLDRISSAINGGRFELMLALILLAGVVSAFYYNDNLMSVSDEMRVYSEAGVSGDCSDSIYLPIGSDADRLKDTFYPYTISGTKVTVMHRKGQTMTLTISVETEDSVSTAFQESRSSDSVILPYIYYDGYVAMDDATEEKYEIYCTADYNVGISIPANYTGQITISYKGKWYWRIAELMSIITCGYLLVRARSIR